VWTNIITKYNSIPLVRKVNPDLTDYVTNQALNGVLKWWLSKKKIRTNLSARTLLQRVFALQDKRYNYSTQATWNYTKKNSSRHRYKTSLNTVLVKKNLKSQ
jgi:hypothetical protein